MSAPSIRRLCDSELMARVGERDVDAFEEIYERYRLPALRMALRVAKQPALAEEVMQDAFLNLWHSARAYDPGRGSLGTWLLTLVRFRGIDSLRRDARRNRDVPIDERLTAQLEAPGSTEDEAVAHEQSREVNSLLGRLPSEQREAVELAYFAGLSQTQIAARSGVPLGTVKGRLRLALNKLSVSVTADSTLARTG